MKEYHIAVFDIGKTNKKLVIYDADLNIQHIEKTKIEEYSIDDINYDDISGIERWILGALKKNASRFNIKVISISAHGATFTCIGENGELVVPELSYTTDPGEDFHTRFFDEMGARETLQQKTCTPDFNLLLNVAKGIKFAQTRFPDLFKKVKYILNYPQYFSYRLTGNATADPTYVGCHTYLWDFHRNSWSDMVDNLDIRPKLPLHLLKPWEPAGNITNHVASMTGLAKDTIVTTGIHDSNASLLPHLISSSGEEFILNSTGTWCVIMHEQDNILFNPDELGKVVFYNLSAFGKPVKTAIFMGGLEYEAYDNIFQKRNSQIPFNATLIQEIIERKELFILPGITKGTGQFPDSDPRVIEGGNVYRFEDILSGHRRPGFFDDVNKAYAVLNLSLAVQTVKSLVRVDMRNGLPIFIEGGFSDNMAYNSLLSSFYPGSKVFLTNLREATACGAALLGKAAVENKHPMEFTSLLHIEKTLIEGVNFSGLEEYARAFLDLV